MAIAWRLAWDALHNFSLEPYSGNLSQARMGQTEKRMPEIPPNHMVYQLGLIVHMLLKDDAEAKCWEQFRMTFGHTSSSGPTCAALKSKPMLAR